MKQIFKNQFKQYILNRLERRVQQFFTHNPQTKLIAVVGSVGKTSTKFAIANVLSQKYRVLAQEGNHNAEVSVPLAILGIEFPDELFSFRQWLAVLRMAKQRTKPGSLPCEVIVIELGTDMPGQIARFGSYLKPDITVISAITAEHMEFFGTLENVAKEELSVGHFSKAVLVNRDDVSEQFASMLEATDIDTYGMSGIAEFHFLVEGMSAKGHMKGTMVTPQFGEQAMQLQVVGEQSVKPIVAAVAVGVRLGLTVEQLKRGAEAVVPVKGRMQPLVGVNGSLLIDDTYNSSPLACIAALQTLYSFPNQQRIAVLGSMNEMGAYSKQAHEEVGSVCDPSLLEWVVTIGDDAGNYLAKTAHGRGCPVKSFKSPIEAGAFVHSVLQPGAVVLLKGSQNGVYAEEATKTLLENSQDEEKLVRQSLSWMEKKNQFLSKF
jgi:UDP-N-acetylmuramoyl-tripeptide--D-alanyl-D-alanine ligase